MKPGISAVIIVYNQGELLKKCLDSLQNWVNEMIIVDLESTEDIEQIAKNYQAIYHREKRVPIVEEVRQKSLKFVQYEYVIFLDPDESIPKTLAKVLADIIKKNTYDYIVTPRQNIAFGKSLMHSRWWPDLQTRVFRVGKLTWPTTLHAVPQVAGLGYTCDAEEQFAISHENYRNLDEFIEKNMRYAKADAKARFNAKQPLSLSETIRLSVSEVMSRFFQGHGYQDGMHGLVLAMLQAFYYFMVYGYYWESQGYSELETEQSIKNFPHAWFSHGLKETLYWEKEGTLFLRLKNKLIKRFLP